MTLQQRDSLWMRLRAAQLVEGEAPEAADANVPWFVRLMLGIAGWLGALFLLAFVGSAFAFVLRNSWAALIVGAGACGAAIAVFRAAPKSDFMAQFGLAVSFAGQLMIVFGLADALGRGARAIAAILVVQSAALFFLVPNFLHRVFCAWAGALAATWLLVDLGLAPLTPAAITAAFLWVWLSEFDFGRQGALARAGGYGLALAAGQAVIMHGPLWAEMMSGFGRRAAQVLPGLEWAGQAASALVLLWAVLRLLRREGLAAGSGPGRTAIAAALILGAASMKAPGVAPAVAILVAGYANGNRVLAGFGIFTLLGYLSHFYYALHVTLLYKSILLAITGAALLIARVAMRHWWPEGREAGHA